MILSFLFWFMFMSSHFFNQQLFQQTIVALLMNVRALVVACSTNGHCFSIKCSWISGCSFDKPFKKKLWCSHFSFEETFDKCSWFSRCSFDKDVDEPSFLLGQLSCQNNDRTWVVVVLTLPWWQKWVQFVVWRPTWYQRIFL